MPPPGVEMGAQVLDITQRFRPDFVIAHLFGRSPSVSIKELKRVGYPLRKVVSLRVGRLRGRRRGRRRLGRGRGLLRAAVRRRGRRLPGAQGDPGDVQEGGQGAAEGDGGSRVLQPRRALGGAPRRGDPQRPRRRSRTARSPATTCKKGFEQIKDFTLGGLVPPLEITADDHEGGGWVQVFQVKGGKFVKATDWFRGYRGGGGQAREGRRPRSSGCAVLALNNIEVIYDGVILVLKGVSLDVPRGRDHHPARRQRRRQDDDPEGDLGPAARRARRGDEGHDRARRRAASTGCRRTRSSSAASSRCSRAGASSST